MKLYMSSRQDCESLIPVVGANTTGSCMADINNESRLKKLNSDVDKL